MRTRWITAIAIGCTLQLSNVGIAQVRDASAADLIMQLEAKEVERRRDAAHELARRGDSSDAVVEALTKGASDDDSQVRVQSLTGLARAGKKSEIAMIALIKCLNHREDQVRYRAATALGAIGTPSIEPLTTHWTSASIDTKIAIAQAFALIGPDARSAIPLLISGLGEKDGLPRYAAEALVSIAGEDESILLKIANHPDVATRKIGIQRIAALDNLSDAAARTLNNAMSDSDPKIREAGIVAIAKSKLQIAEKANFHRNRIGRHVFIGRAAGLSAMTKAALPAPQFAERLATRLSSVDGDGANTVVKAITLLGQKANSALPAVVLSASKDGIDQRLVSKCLAGFGASVVPDLLAAIDRQPQQEAVFSQALG